MSYRVEFGGGAQLQFHTLPEYARDALIERAAQLAGEPWDAVVRPPGDDPRFREVVPGSGSGILGFYLDEDAQLIIRRSARQCLRDGNAVGPHRPGRSAWLRAGVYRACLCHSVTSGYLLMAAS